MEVNISYNICVMVPGYLVPLLCNPVLMFMSCFGAFSVGQTSAWAT